MENYQIAGIYYPVIIKFKLEGLTLEMIFYWYWQYEIHLVDV